MAILISFVLLATRLKIFCQLITLSNVLCIPLCQVCGAFADCVLLSWYEIIFLCKISHIVCSPRRGFAKLDHIRTFKIAAVISWNYTRQYF